MLRAIHVFVPQISSHVRRNELKRNRLLAAIRSIFNLRRFLNLSLAEDQLELSDLKIDV